MLIKIHDLLIIAVCTTGVLSGVFAFYWELGMYNYVDYYTMQRIALYSFFVTVGLTLISIMNAVNKKEETHVATNDLRVPPGIPDKPEAKPDTGFGVDKQPDK